MSEPSQAPAARTVLTCGGTARARWGRLLDDLADREVAVGEQPGRAEVDPVLDGLLATAPGAGARLVVAGTDASLAAVLVRLLRRERLDVAVAFLPGPDSEAAAVWGLPTGSADAAALARHGTPRAAPLVRDDRGGVVAVRHVLGPFHGTVYCDEHLVWRGDATALEVRPDDAARGVAVEVTGPRRLAGLRAGAVRHCSGRATQVGCHPAPVVRDGVRAERTVERRSWYRHTDDWWLVRP